MENASEWRYDWFRRTSASSAAQILRYNETDDEISISEEGIYSCRGRRGDTSFLTEDSNRVTIENRGKSPFRNPNTSYLLWRLYSVPGRFFLYLFVSRITQQLLDGFLVNFVHSCWILLSSDTSNLFLLVKCLNSYWVQILGIILVSPVVASTQSIISGLLWRANVTLNVTECNIMVSFICLIIFGPKSDCCCSDFTKTMFDCTTCPNSNSATFFT